MVVFIKFSNGRCVVLNFGGRQECSGWELKKEILTNECLPTELEDCIFLSHNGRILSSDTLLHLDQDDNWVTCHVKVLGGKGGFGSMLRAIGAQIEKTTNREACRDLSGRRMRDVNDEKKIAEWLAKQSERDEEKARLKRERLERLQSGPRHVFEDNNKYTSQLQENIESVEDALQTGLKSTASVSTSSLGKRKADEKGRKKQSKKQKLWLGIDEDLSSESDDESEVGSSSSVGNNTDVSSETSSRISTVSGQTSESETVKHEENTATSALDALRSPNQSSSPSKIVGEQVKTTVCDSTVTSSLGSSTSTSDADNQKGQAVPEKTGKGKDDAEKKTSSLDISAKSEVKLDTIVSKSVSPSLSEPLDLEKYNSVEELETLGLDILKTALVTLGLKCGGTLRQRADRLFSIKGVPRDKIDPSLLAKPSGKRQRKAK